MAALDTLVCAGKVRYIGVSDTPAWKIAQANVLAQFRGWAAFIGLQIEYSLLQRSVEQELVPLALEFGLGITPWSPLKSGALSGKYTRNNLSATARDRGPFLEPYLNETTFALLDALELIAKAHESTVARIALAWVAGRPGVASTIIGARRLEQLEDNLGALGLDLSPQEVARLDALTAPTFGFPQSMMPIFPAIHNGGTTVNGVHAPASGFGLVKGEKPY
jgi:aryl-alcohol dehydrogenase-like predicted oxidoreductase